MKVFSVSEPASQKHATKIEKIENGFIKDKAQLSYAKVKSFKNVQIRT